MVGGREGEGGGHFYRDDCARASSSSSTVLLCVCRRYAKKGLAPVWKRRRQSEPFDEQLFPSCRPSSGPVHAASPSHHPALDMATLRPHWAQIQAQTTSSRARALLLPSSVPSNSQLQLINITQQHFSAIRALKFDRNVAVSSSVPTPLRGEPSQSYLSRAPTSRSPLIQLIHHRYPQGS